MGTFTYSYTYATSQLISSGATVGPVSLSSYGSAVSGTPLVGNTTLQITASSVSSRAIGFSAQIIGTGGTYETLGSNLAFTSTSSSSVVGTWGTSLTSATAQAMLTSPAARSFRIVANADAPGMIMFYATQIKLSIEYTEITNVGAPTSASASPTVCESDPTITWSGAKIGSGNDISGYEIQYAESSNNSSWGSWTAVKTVSSTATSGSTTVTMPSTRSYYRKYRIRTQGSAGSSYYSGWLETNVVRRNAIPLGPTSVTASPSQFVDEKITVSWSGASSATSTIKGYMLAYRSSATGTPSGSWTVITTLTLSATSGSYTYTPSVSIGTYINYGVWTIDALDVYSGETVSNTIQRVAATACIPPSTVTLSPAIVETSLTLSWSGASGSSGNTITGYDLHYSNSSDGSSWDSWQSYSTVTSTSTSGSATNITPPSTRGAYIKFRVRTRGTAGESLYSSWAESNPARRNTLPTAPTTFTAAPESYYNPTITLSWSNTVPGTSSIKNYIIQSSTSTDGNNWTGWTALTTVSSTATSGTYQATATTTDGVKTRYRIAVTDSLAAVSSYTTSNTIQRMNRPEAPIVNAPRNNSTIYNTLPRFLVKTGGVPDGRSQKIVVVIGSNTYNSVSNAELFSVAGSLINGVATIFKAPQQSLGSKNVTIRCENDAGVSTEVTRSFTVSASPFEEIIPGVTVVKVSHMTIIRDAVDKVRSYYSLAGVAWADPIVPKRTQVRDWPVHIKEVRTAIEAVITAINTHDSVSIFDVPLPTWVPLSSGPPKADVMKQITELILNL